MDAARRLSANTELHSAASFYFLVAVLVTVVRDSTQSYSGPCPVGYFGWKCRLQCRCKDGEQCDRVTGRCPLGCAETAWGVNCQLESNCTYNDLIGANYLGKQNVTKDGESCLYWTGSGYEASKFPDTTLEEIQNYCRNPFKPIQGGVWCYTAYRNRFLGNKWDVCSIAECECPAHLFGLNCEKQCHCSNPHETCDQKSGHCSSGCADRWTGYNCQDCSHGYWGIVCNSTCSDTCRTGCDQTSGACCPSNKMGPSCNKDLPTLRNAPWKVSAATASSITVEWYRWEKSSTGDGTGPVTKYRLQYRETPSDAPVEWSGQDVSETTQSNTLQYTALNLKFNTEYQFRVACYYSPDSADVHLLGSYTASMSIRTECEAPSPVDLRRPHITGSVDTANPSQIRLAVSWQDIADVASGCDSIDRYILYYKKKSTYERWKSQRQNRYASDKGQMITVAVTDLDPYTDYEMLVKSINNQNKEASSNSVEYRTPEARSGPVHIISIASRSPEKLFVTWNSPSQPNGVISHYELQYRQTAIGDCDSTPRDWSSPLTINNCSYEIDNLKPYSQYAVKITPVNGYGRGEAASVYGSTEESVPSGAPVAVRAFSIRKRLAGFDWKEPVCEQRNGKITSYVYHIEGLLYSELNQTETANQVHKYIYSLTPYANYSFKVAAVTSAGTGPFCEQVLIRTKPDVPPSPRHVRIPSTRPFGLTVVWDEPYPPHGQIEKYRVNYRRQSGYQLRGTEIETENTAVDINGLQTSQTYIIQVQAKTSEGWGALSREVHGFTKEQVPSKPESFRLLQRGARWLTFSWNVPSYPNGIITDYKLSCGDKHTVDIEGTAEHDNVTVTDLTPGSLYSCSVRAATKVGYSNSSTVLPVWTLPEAPRVPDVRVDAADVATTESTIKFILPVIHGQRITSFEVHVDKEDVKRMKRAVFDRDERMKRAVFDRDERMKRAVFDMVAIDFTICNNNSDKRDIYIAAELTSKEATGVFTVGDNKKYGRYWNCPLVKDSTYSIYYAAVVKSLGGDESRSFVKIGKYSASNQTNKWIVVVIIIITCLCVIGVAVIIGFLWKMKKGDKKRKERIENGKHQKSSFPLLPKPLTAAANQHRDTDEGVDLEEIYENAPTVQNDFHKPLKIDNLLAYISWGRANSNAGFIAEYNSLPSGLSPTISHIVGSKPENRPKNRFVNIIPYDHSRVVLERLKEDPHSDFINASYVTGYKKPKKFIASQGPTKVMICDFWRMIWQYSVSRVVMVTNLVEQTRMKCEQYWPCGGVDADQIYAGISVHLEQEDILSDFTVRTLIMTKGRERKTVWQFHYTAWPDHGVPDHATSLLSFRRKVASYDNVSHGPIVVHCSAGVGRTGTFIALDYLLEQAKVESQVGIYSFVELMRKQRVNMIQTLDQYMFLYGAIFEGVRCGDMIVTATDFTDSYEDFITPYSGYGNKSKLDKQFELLIDMQLNDEDEECAGRLVENVNKNRFMDIIPRNICRPYLTTQVPNGTDYINAVYIDGYRLKNAFMVTQMPLPDHVVDIWRLVLDHRAHTIITLIDDDKTCAPYWPVDGAEPSVFGPITVMNNGTECHMNEAIIIRKFSLSLKGKGSPDNTWEVKHFQVRDWPMQTAVPSSASTLLYLLDMVEQWQRYKKDQRVIVQCLDGASRSGIFVALSYILEKLKLEREIDIFNAIHHIQVNRPQLVSTKEQYKFCHDAVIEYLQSCETYSNFS